MLKRYDTQRLENEVSSEIMSQNGSSLLDHLSFDIDFGVHLNETVDDENENRENLEKRILWFLEDKIVGDRDDIVEVENTDENFPEDELRRIRLKEWDLSEIFIETPFN